MNCSATATQVAVLGNGSRVHLDPVNELTGI